MNLQERTEAQLLADFDGEVQPNLKLLNLIYSVFRAIEKAGGTITWDDIEDKPAFGSAALEDSAAFYPAPSPVPFDNTPEGIAAALVSLGLMQAE